MSKQVPYHLVIQQMEKRIDLLEEENANLKVRIQNLEDMPASLPDIVRRLVKIEDSLWKQGI